MLYKWLRCLLIEMWSQSNPGINKNTFLCRESGLRDVAREIESATRQVPDSAQVHLDPVLAAPTVGWGESNNPESEYIS